MTDLDTTTGDAGASKGNGGGAIAGGGLPAAPESGVAVAERLIRMALGVMAAAPEMTGVDFDLAYNEYNDEYHENPEWSLEYRGRHRDEDLDAVPQARRLERTFERELEGLPVRTDCEGVQETARLTVRRDGAELQIDPMESSYALKIVRWTIVDGEIVGRRHLVRLPAESGVSAHQRLAAAGGRLALEEIATCEESWPFKLPLVGVTPGEVEHRLEFVLAEIPPDVAFLGLGGDEDPEEEDEESEEGDEE